MIFDAMVVGELPGVPAPIVPAVILCAPFTALNVKLPVGVPEFKPLLVA